MEKGKEDFVKLEDISHLKSEKLRSAVKDLLGIATTLRKDIEEHLEMKKEELKENNQSVFDKMVAAVGKDVDELQEEQPVEQLTEEDCDLPHPLAFCKKLSDHCDEVIEHYEDMLKNAEQVIVRQRRQINRLADEIAKEIKS